MVERRILHVAQPVEAGVAAVVLAFAVHQRTLGHRVAVACPPHGDLPDRARRAGLEVLAWPATRQPGPGLIREMRVLGAAVRSFDPDLVHLHSSKAGLVGRLVLRGRRPTVFQPHAWSFLASGGVEARAARVWERFGARWCDRIVAVSEAERAAGRAARVGGRHVVVHNGVDTTRFAPLADVDRVAMRGVLEMDDAQLVVCVGRLCRQKGQDLALDAWATVRERCADACLVLVGDGPDRALLTARAGADVRFVGETADVASWLGVADVVIAPSRWEGQSLALLEAMATGASIVATDVAGVREALPADGGAVVPVDDPAALADAIVLRLGDVARRAREGNASRARAMAEFDIARAERAIDDLYEELVAVRPPRSS